MINKINIKNFLGLKEFSGDNLPMVNVIIGSNDSGKTAIIKILYAVTKALDDFEKKPKVTNEPFKRALGDKIINTFQPRKNGLGELVFKGTQEKLSVDLMFSNKKEQEIKFTFGETTNNSIIDCTENANIQMSADKDGYNTVFIPSKEVLTALEAIALTRESYNMIGFDDTYYDLIVNLRVPVQAGRLEPGFTKVNNDLEGIFEGSISQGTKENPFIFKKGKSEFTMPLTAEGIKKVGILTTLIKNRRLRKNTVLFMDEPETALHPKAVRVLAEIIVLLSKADIQIFITSHSYFLIKQLSIIAKRDDIDINCFSLIKEIGEPVQYSIQNMRNGLPDNPIIDEALAMFNQEIINDLKV